MVIDDERCTMSDPLADDEKPLDPAAASIVAKVRWLMLISAGTTFVAVAAVLGGVGYRVFKSDGSAPQTDVTALLPRGARIVSTAVAEDRIAVTIDVGGAMELRTFDIRTLKQTRPLRLA